MKRSVAVLALVAGCLAQSAWAQEGVGSPPTRSETNAPHVASERDFGPVPLFYSAVDAYDMKPWSDTGQFVHSISTGGLFCTQGSPERRVIGQLIVPHGVQLLAFRAWLLDAHAGERVEAVLEESCLPDFGPALPSNRSLATVSSTDVGADNFGFSGSDVPPANTLADNQSCTLRVRVTLGVGSCPDFLVLGFYKARVEWKRFIPPAPAVASFTDVPTTDGSFAVVEALKASGVTQGCTLTEFCPAQAVTRAQMAAFLARALGLPAMTIVDSANP
jgi:hypothetical protein